MAKMEVVSEKIESKNRALVLEAFDTLFNKRDYAAAERFWSPDYIQHVSGTYPIDNQDGDAPYISFPQARIEKLHNETNN
jgi:predicted SnoaL-like aldol condensation-catalyzing enzyme